MIEEFILDEREPVPTWLVEHLCATDSVAFAGGFEAGATEPDLWAAASSLNVPVLPILGVDEAEDSGAALGRQLVHAMPEAELVTLDVAHLAAFHRVDLTVPLFARFLGHVSGRP